MAISFNTAFFAAIVAALLVIQPVARAEKGSPGNQCRIDSEQVAHAAELLRAASDVPALAVAVIADGRILASAADCSGFKSVER